MKKYFLVTFIFILGSLCTDELPTNAPITVEADRFFSPYASSPTLLSVHDSIRRGGDYYFHKSFHLDTTKINRCIEMGFFYMPVSYLTMVFQHEVCGHGFRLRSFKKDVAKVQRYTFKLPPPFGGGGAATYYTPTNKFSSLHSSLCATGGIEATSILAHHLRMKWLMDNKIYAKDNLLHLFSHHDLSNYAFSLLYTREEKATAGHDIFAYKNKLHKLNPSTKINKYHLASLSFINYLNPFDFLAWSAMHNYAASGHTSTPLSMLKVKNVSMLPMLRIGFAPYGPELFTENYMHIKERPVYAYAKGGFLASSRYGGLGFECPSLLRMKNHHVGMTMHLWHHPLLNQEQNFKFGAAGCATYRFQTNGGQWGAQIEAGHKMHGYLPGHPFEAAPIIRGALNLKI